MAPLAPLAVGAGVGLSVVSQIQAGREEQKQLEQRAGVARAEGLEAERAGLEQGRLTRAEGRRLVARQRVGAAGKGVKSFTGAPLLLQEETLSEIEREADILTTEGRTTKQKAFAQARFDEKTGKRRRRAGLFGGIATGLSGFGGLGLATRS